MFILFEHASGYALFRVKEFEEVSMLQSQVEKSVTDLSKFQSIVKLVAFSPFKSGTNALDNINSISEGRLLNITVIVLLSVFFSLEVGPVWCYWYSKICGIIIS